MATINDTFKNNLEEAAQALGNILLRASLGIKTEESPDDIYPQASSTALKWAVQGTSLSEAELLGYIEGSDYKNDKDHVEASERYFEAMKTFREMYEPYEELMSELSKEGTKFILYEKKQNKMLGAWLILLKKHV